MNTKQNCFRKALNLLNKHNYLPEEDFIKMLVAMGFSKDTVLNTLNDLCESSLVEYKSGEFKFSV